MRYLVENEAGATYRNAFGETIFVPMDEIISDADEKEMYVEKKLEGGKKTKKLKFGYKELPDADIPAAIPAAPAGGGVQVPPGAVAEGKKNVEKLKASETGA